MTVLVSSNWQMQRRFAQRVEAFDFQTDADRQAKVEPVGETAPAFALGMRPEPRGVMRPDV